MMSYASRAVVLIAILGIIVQLSGQISAGKVKGAAIAVAVAAKAVSKAAKKLKPATCLECQSNSTICVGGTMTTCAYGITKCQVEWTSNDTSVTNQYVYGCGTDNHCKTPDYDDCDVPTLGSYEQIVCCSGSRKLCNPDCSGSNSKMSASVSVTGVTAFLLVSQWNNF